MAGPVLMTRAVRMFRHLLGPVRPVSRSTLLDGMIRHHIGSLQTADDLAEVFHREQEPIAMRPRAKSDGTRRQIDYGVAHDGTAAERTDGVRCPGCADRLLHSARQRARKVVPVRRTTEANRRALELGERVPRHRFAGAIAHRVHAGLRLPLRSVIDRHPRALAPRHQHHALEILGSCDAPAATAAIIEREGFEVAEAVVPTSPNLPVTHSTPGQSSSMLSSFP